MGLFSKNYRSFTQKIVTKLSKIWIWDPGSGSRGLKGTGSVIRIRNTGNNANYLFMKKRVLTIRLNLYKSFICVPNQFFSLSLFCITRNLKFKERCALVHVMYSISLYFVHLKYQDAMKLAKKSLHFYPVSDP